MRYLAWKRETRLALVDDPVMDLHFRLQRFAAVLSILGPDFTCVVERPIRAACAWRLDLPGSRALARPRLPGRALDDPALRPP